MRSFNLHRSLSWIHYSTIHMRHHHAQVTRRWYFCIWFKIFSHIETLAPEAGISFMDKKLHPTKYSEIQLFIPSWGEISNFVSGIKLVKYSHVFWVRGGVGLLWRNQSLIYPVIFVLHAMPCCGSWASIHQDDAVLLEYGFPSQTWCGRKTVLCLQCWFICP